MAPNGNSHNDTDPALGEFVASYSLDTTHPLDLHRYGFRYADRTFDFAMVENITDDHRYFALHTPHQTIKIPAQLHQLVDIIGYRAAIARLADSIMRLHEQRHDLRARLDFGAVQLSPQGIHVAGEMLAWLELTALQRDTHTLRLSYFYGEWKRIPLSTIHHPRLVELLIQEAHFLRLWEHEWDIERAIAAKINDMDAIDDPLFKMQFKRVRQWLSPSVKFVIFVVVGMAALLLLVYGQWVAAGGLALLYAVLGYTWWNDIKLPPLWYMQPQEVFRRTHHMRPVKVETVQIRQRGLTLTGRNRQTHGIDWQDIQTLLFDLAGGVALQHTGGTWFYFSPYFTPEVRPYLREGMLPVLQKRALTLLKRGGTLTVGRLTISREGISDGKRTVHFREAVWYPFARPAWADISPYSSNGLMVEALWDYVIRKDNHLPSGRTLDHQTVTTARIVVEAVEEN